MPSKLPSGAIGWSFVLAFSVSAGVIFAILTIFGWIHGWEGSVALTIFIVASVAVVWRGMRRRMLHGFAVGFLSALVAIELQAAFLPLYFANNPGYELIEIPFGLPARLATAIFAPIHATLAGIVTAGIVWVLSRFWSRDANETAA